MVTRQPLKLICKWYKYPSFTHYLLLLTTMTRTARSSFPRAIYKDRSESKSGTDKHMRKDGGGPHGWGRISDERRLENDAILDEELEEGVTLAMRTSSLHTLHFLLLSYFPTAGSLARSASASSTSEEELESARKFRQNALKGPSMSSP